MTKKAKNLIIYSLVGMLILIALLYKFLPANVITNIAGNDNAISKTLCTMPIKISGESMEPFLKSGETVKLNKCFEPSQIKENTVILFKDGSVNRLAVIKSIDGATIKLFQPNRTDRQISDITIEDVVAIYEENFNDSNMEINEN